MERHNCLTIIKLIILGHLLVYAVVLALYGMVNPIYVVETSLYYAVE